MAKYLFAIWPSVGHVNPGLPIAEKLIERGHEVVWYTSTHFQEKIESIGVTFIPFKNLRNFSGSTLKEDFPEMPDLTGLQKFKWGVRNIIANTMEGFDKDLTEIRKEFEPDVLVIDPTFTGLIPMRLRGESLKVVCYGILPLSVTSKDTTPFGLGVIPKSTVSGRWKNQFLNFFVQKVVFRQEQHHFNKLLKKMELPKLKNYFLDVAVMESDLYLQGTCPSFEYPRSDLPTNVKFVGPYNAMKAAKTELPTWWSEVTTNKPVVHVTQGTLANADKNNLIIPTIRALADEDVLVVVTTGNNETLQEVPDIPNNVRVEKFIPYDLLLPHVDVMITNAGYGGVHFAIQNGVPLITAGTSEDKPEVSARVEWAGIGINLRTETPSEEQIRSSVRDILMNSSYKNNVSKLQKEFERYDAYQLTVQHLEEIVS
ncbi:nucleotide disphospho-sugar-binding domain-containing protein [Evansella sp. AB-rgal1]|uniref:nucleotide disphospho-sugar-binding domain-containing protein n=1 Tax=Evansella sp. AB-rgal1 TaxID=3242696 RepID=UPI00359EEA8E